MAKPSFYTMSFARIYPLYIQKAEKKGRTKAEVDEIILWLTGHTAKSLQKAIDAEIDLETFFAKAPRFQPNANLITGVVCGVRVEEIEDETMRKIRYLDKLIDELAKGKAMEKILRKIAFACPLRRKLGHSNGFFGGFRDEKWMMAKDRWAVRAGWHITASRVKKDADGLDLPALSGPDHRSSDKGE